jgi:hypothetical protein
VLQKWDRIVSHEEPEAGNLHIRVKHSFPPEAGFCFQVVLAAKLPGHVPLRHFPMSVAPTLIGERCSIQCCPP